MLEEQDVVVTRLQQRSLEIIRFREGDSSEVAAAQHLSLALEIHSGEQFSHSL